MEVGKLIEAVQKQKAHMVISVKPFGCMPSASVSDGVQTSVLTRHPEAIFCAVETTGDGAVNFQSRVQMFLFKARQKARREFEAALQQRGLNLELAERRMERRNESACHYPVHTVAGTGANQVLES
jgi:predicted nucleotide-binding protein (sugar kinase/HSP70/actin superfamily)